MKKSIKKKSEVEKAAVPAKQVKTGKSVPKKTVKAEEIKRGKKDKDTKQAEKEIKAKKAAKVKKKTQEKPPAPAANSVSPGKVKSSAPRSKTEKSRKAQVPKKEAKPAKIKAIKEPAVQTMPAVPEEREVKIESFFYDLSSLQKSGTDPKGTMLVAKYKQHEIGIHVDPKLSSLMFSYYPKQGTGEMVNIPISIKDIISFIAQKAG